MKKRPVIGVLPLWDEKKNSFWMLPGYLEGVRQAGGLPLMFPMTQDEDELQQLLDLSDGILFTGGHDVDPAIYGEDPLPGLISSCPERDRMETRLLEGVLREKVPSLGICRGIQLFNAFLGGTLYQDLHLQHPSPVCHVQKPPYDRMAHPVRLEAGSPLQSLLRTEEIRVNSYHHQAIRNLAPGLVPMARSQDDLVEAVCLPEHPFFWGVQWHPEFCWATESASRAVFGAFVSACEEKSRKRERG